MKNSVANKLHKQAVDMRHAFAKIANDETDTESVVQLVQGAMELDSVIRRLAMIVNRAEKD